MTQEEFMDSVFTYKVGDLLMFKAQAGGDNPNALHVVGRILEQCSGGCQRHYLCRVTQIGRFESSGTIKEGWTLHELELVPYVTPVKK